MEKLYATLIGLVAGILGYLAANFWFHPIFRYRDLRSQIISDLVYYKNAISPDKGHNDYFKEERVKQRIMANRRHSSDLKAVYFEMPKWYKFYLKKRGIHPDKAVPELIGLSNTFEFRTAEKRLEKIQKLLGITPPVV